MMFGVDQSLLAFESRFAALGADIVRRSGFKSILAVEERLRPTSDAE